MNITIVSYSLLCGGIERAVANLANHWAEKGWEVSVVTIESQEKDFYNLNPKVKRIGMGLAGETRNIFEKIWKNFKRIYTLYSILQKINIRYG